MRRAAGQGSQPPGQRAGANGRLALLLANHTLPTLYSFPGGQNVVGQNVVGQNASKEEAAASGGAAFHAR